MRGAAMLLCLIAGTAVAGCSWFDDRRVPARGEAFTASGQLSNDAISPAHNTLGAAANDFFAVKSTPQQPIEFPHNIHVEKGLACTEYCHESVTKGPRAGLPSVNTCLICHAAIATDRPRIQQITQMADKGIDLSWQRVYGYPATAHVRFNHAPHIRANVECATCHGDIAHQTVAQRNVDLHMGYCVNCHRQKKAPNDCLTCHY
jgi:hypothetical protein